MNTGNRFQTEFLNKIYGYSRRINLIPFKDKEYKLFSILQCNFYTLNVNINQIFFFHNNNNNNGKIFNFALIFFSLL